MTASVTINSVLESAWLALTPRERWSAARSLGGGSGTGRWMIIACLAALVVLVVLLWLVSVRRGKKERKSSGKTFEEYARQSGLSVRERQLLVLVANRAGVKRPESIFAMGSAFNTGAAKVVEEWTKDKGAAEEAEQLKMEMAFLREKLGFGRKSPSASGPDEGLKRVTTRQIPVGKSLYVTRRKDRTDVDIESVVARNTDSELAVTLKQTVKIVFGEAWCVRYYSGTSVWEFDTTVISYDGDTLVLNHSDDVRFVNRRRFLRVSVKLDAFIARFPFMRGVDEGDRTYLDERSGGVLEPPRFVPAVVTELAGPGLRVEAPLDVETGERILVVFDLNQRDSKGQGHREDEGKPSYPVIVENAGEVRHVKATENAFSIAVELMGLHDSDVDELIRATNAACVRASSKPEESPVAVGQGV